MGVVTSFDRDLTLQAVQQRQSAWDLIVIGGGATGVAVALDAAARGLEVLLLEGSDFGKGTSSRSTKLVHGGVRYLRQGNVALVRDALRERALLLANAPHLVTELPFLIPCHSRWERWYYRIGLKLYDSLAIGERVRSSKSISTSDVRAMSPAVASSSLSGGVVYYDGQFDDARLLLSMAMTAADRGGHLLNYARVTGLTKHASGRISGVQFSDLESGQMHQAAAKCVINATGPFSDSVRRMDDPQCQSMIAASQGVHLVLPRKCFPGEMALIVPKTSDGRVIFIIPWHDVVLVGTTDTPIDEPQLEPRARDEEIRFLLDTASAYLATPITLEMVLAIFVGIRPLVSDDSTKSTSSLSRDHVIKISDAGLITISGGKWTTVRGMGEDCVDTAVREGGLSAGPCITKTLRLHGWMEPDQTSAVDNARSLYGSDLASIVALEQGSPAMATRLHPELPLRGSEVLWSVRAEMARTVDDVLARRSRCLVFNSRAAVEVAAKVAELMAAELNRDQEWQRSQVAEFEKIAERYLPPTSI